MESIAQSAFGFRVFEMLALGDAGRLPLGDAVPAAAGVLLWLPGAERERLRLALFNATRLLEADLLEVG